MPRIVAALLLLSLAGAATAAETQLRFLRDGQLLGTIDRKAMAEACDAQRIEIDDPYYEKRMTYVGCPLREVLEKGFGMPAANLAGEDFFLRALDGFVAPATGEKLVEDGGFVAFADAERLRGDDPGWQPIGRRQLDPGPFYVVWKGKGQVEARGYPWPYQLVEIEIERYAEKYPKTLPQTAEKDSAAWQGFTIFKTQCLFCHSINGQGGKIGPDLNVPRSIVEYRPVDQIKAYIVDPTAFRYTTMPSHRDLTDAQLDQLIAYFDTMKTLKDDPGK
jgi:mono/diheme cytochrome c family protein